MWAKSTFWFKYGFKASWTAVFAKILAFVVWVLPPATACIALISVGSSEEVITLPIKVSFSDGLVNFS